MRGFNLFIIVWQLNRVLSEEKKRMRGVFLVAAKRILTAYSGLYSQRMQAYAYAAKTVLTTHASVKIAFLRERATSLENIRTTKLLSTAS